MEPALALGLTITAVALIVLPLVSAGILTYIGIAFAGPEGWVKAFMEGWIQALIPVTLVLMGIWILVGLFLLILKAIS